MILPRKRMGTQTILNSQFSIHKEEEIHHLTNLYICIYIISLCIKYFLEGFDEMPQDNATADYGYICFFHLLLLFHFINKTLLHFTL